MWLALNESCQTSKRFLSSYLALRAVLGTWGTWKSQMGSNRRRVVSGVSFTAASGVTLLDPQTARALKGRGWFHPAEAPSHHLCCFHFKAHHPPDRTFQHGCSVHVWKWGDLETALGEQWKSPFSLMSFSGAQPSEGRTVWWFGAQVWKSDGPECEYSFLARGRYTKWSNSVPSLNLSLFIHKADVRGSTS